mmetsp:Transcript_47723/g.107060  ORF Transcript_47723/g.107060 Transcript_47723/m.107060 type:complete len:117 (+) Transcript_47723:1291-1641(+)
MRVQAFPWRRHGEDGGEPSLEMESVTVSAMWFVSIDTMLPLPSVQLASIPTPLRVWPSINIDVKETAAVIAVASQHEFLRKLLCCWGNNSLAVPAARPASGSNAGHFGEKSRQAPA